MIDKDLKHGDKVLFTSNRNDSKLEGRFVGYSNSDDKRCIVEHGGPFCTTISYALTCEKEQEPKKRLLTPKELAGKFIRYKGDINYGELVWLFKEEHFYMGVQKKKVTNEFEYTSTPSDDKSWKSVEVEVEVEE